MIIGPMPDPSGNWNEFVSWLFLLTNTGRIVAYLPQIRAAWTCPSGARSVSLLTWSYFAVAHLAALLYAIHVLRDSRSTLIFAGNLAVTLCLVMVLVWRRWVVAADHRPVANPSIPVASVESSSDERPERGVRMTALSSETGG